MKREREREGGFEINFKKDLISGFSRQQSVCVRACMCVYVCRGISCCCFSMVLTKRMIAEQRLEGDKGITMCLSGGSIPGRSAKAQRWGVYMACLKNRKESNVSRME